MKKKDLQTLKDKEKTELQQGLKEARENLFSLRLDFMQNKLKNVKALFIKRKEIAQIAGILREKELIK